MRRKLSLTIALMLFVAVASPTVAVAQQDAVVEDEQASQATQTDEETQESESDRSAGRSKRIKEYKDKAAERLSAVEARRIAGVCNATQGKVASLRKRYNAAIQRRKDAYNNITNKLNILVNKLQAASVDTTLLEAANAELDSLITTAVAAVEQFEAVITDLAEMDCTSDPEGFKAALSIAREQRAEAAEASTAVKSYAKGELKSLLQSIREQLSTDETETNEDNS